MPAGSKLVERQGAFLTLAGRQFFGLYLFRRKTVSLPCGRNVRGAEGASGLVTKQSAAIFERGNRIGGHVDAESKVAERPQDHKLELRLWLRLLASANLIEVEVRRRLRERFGTTLPRFDLLAQLERVEDGLLLGELSRRMMVSNGNVTGLVERLGRSGLIERNVLEADRRAVRVRLTQKGREVFAEMAAAHADWIGELFAGLSEVEQTALWSRLGTLKASVLAASKRAERRAQLP
jgi:DNA-binding MarR family transcriptional regulator